MKQKILKLIKRLSRFTIDDIAIMSEYDEKALVPVIDNFEDDGIIKKISDKEYGYIAQNKEKSALTAIIENNSDKKIKKVNIDFKTINTKQLFKKENEQEIFNNTPDWAKAKIIKHMTVLKLAGNLNGIRLYKFLKQLGKDTPEYKVSYSTLMRKRRDYVTYGIKGLIPLYKNDNHKSSVTDEMFEDFKSLYFTSYKYTLSQCVKMLKKKYEILPHPAAFKRRLDKEYSKEVIDKLRNLPLNLAEINHPATTSNHKDIKNKNEIKYENFIQGARVYLKSIEKSKNEFDISRKGYLKNHLLPYFKNYKFKDITPQVLQNYQSYKIAEGFTPSSIKRFTNLLRLIMLEYGDCNIDFHFSANNTLLPMLETNILTDMDIKDIIKNQLEKLWIICLGITPAELAALDYTDIDFERRVVKINKAIVNNTIIKHRTLYKNRDLRIPQILFKNIPNNKTGRIFNDINIEDYDLLLNTHIHLLLNKGVQINIISKNLGYASLSEFEKRFNFLLPQQLDNNFEILN